MNEQLKKNIVKIYICTVVFEVRLEIRVEFSLRIGRLCHVCVHTLDVFSS
jgi:hypothetical protein